MKILRFKGRKINNYIDLDLDFNNDLSILIGVNGAGKTTALNLIEAILCPKIDYLLTVPFLLCEVLIFDRGEYNTIKVLKNDKGLKIVSSNITDSLNISIKKEDFQMILFNEDKDNLKLNEQLLSVHRDNSMLDYLRDLPSPIFIGLERNGKNPTEEYKNYLLERNLFNHKKNRNTIKSYRRSLKGNLGISLLETELMVQNAYRSVKAKVEKYSAQIQKDLFLGSFNYVSIEDVINTPFEFAIGYDKKKIFDSLRRMGVKDTELLSKIDDFFSRMEELSKNRKSDESSPNIEWILNKTQINRLNNLVVMLESYEQLIAHENYPIDKFVSTINSFFKDTNKEIVVDEVGSILVRTPNDDYLTLDELSSGERQLVVLFAMVIFGNLNPNSLDLEPNSGLILIIDEPEISLHIRWQERFIKSLLEVTTSGNQFIIATHSPDIVGSYDDKAILLSRI